MDVGGFAIDADGVDVAWLLALFCGLKTSRVLDDVALKNHVGERRVLWFLPGVE